MNKHTEQAAKHTPGAAISPTPWTVQTLVEGWHGYAEWTTYAVRDARNVCLASVGDVDRLNEAYSAANARLIAAAPDLLQAAKAHYALLENLLAGLTLAKPNIAGAIENLRHELRDGTARRAIARAEGADTD